MLLENLVIPERIIYTNSMLSEDERNVESYSALMPVFGSSTTIPKISEKYLLIMKRRYGSKHLIITIMIPVKNEDVNEKNESVSLIC